MAPPTHVPDLLKANAAFVEEPLQLLKSNSTLEINPSSISYNTPEMQRGKSMNRHKTKQIHLQSRGNSIDGSSPPVVISAKDTEKTTAAVVEGGGLEKIPSITPTITRTLSNSGSPYKLPPTANTAIEPIIHSTNTPAINQDPLFRDTPARLLFHTTVSTATTTAAGTSTTTAPILAPTSAASSSTSTAHIPTIRSNKLSNALTSQSANSLPSNHHNNNHNNHNQNNNSNNNNNNLVSINTTNSISSSTHGSVPTSSANSNLAHLTPHKNRLLVPALNISSPSPSTTTHHIPTNATSSSTTPSTSSAATTTAATVTLPVSTIEPVEDPPFNPNETMMFHHYSFPKSIANTSSAHTTIANNVATPPNNNHHHSNHSTPSNSNSNTLGRSASKGKTNRLNPFPASNAVMVEQTPPIRSTVNAAGSNPSEEEQQAVTNDKILQERLQEAKALNRRQTSNYHHPPIEATSGQGIGTVQGQVQEISQQDAGAVMHQFSLWKKKSNVSNTDIGVDAATSNTPKPIAPSSSSKLRGPRGVIEQANHQSASQKANNVVSFSLKPIDADVSSGQEGGLSPMQSEIMMVGEAQHIHGRSLLDTSLQSVTSKDGSQTPANALDLSLLHDPNTLDLSYQEDDSDLLQSPLATPSSVINSTPGTKSKKFDFAEVELDISPSTLQLLKGSDKSKIGKVSGTKETESAKGNDSVNSHTVLSAESGNNSKSQSANPFSGGAALKQLKSALTLSSVSAADEVNAEVHAIVDEEEIGGGSSSGSRRNSKNLSFGLANSLRNRIDNAKQLMPALPSPNNELSGGQTSPLEINASNDSAFTAAKPSSIITAGSSSSKCDNMKTIGTVPSEEEGLVGYNQSLKDPLSDEESIPEDISLPRPSTTTTLAPLITRQYSMGREETSQSLQTFMSKSGPATFLSSIKSSSNTSSSSNTPNTTIKKHERVRRKSETEETIQDAVRMRSLTSRESNRPRNLQQREETQPMTSRAALNTQSPAPKNVSIGVGSEKKVSKYQRLRNLRSQQQQRRPSTSESSITSIEKKQEEGFQNKVHDDGMESDIEGDDDGKVHDEDNSPNLSELSEDEDAILYGHQYNHHHQQQQQEQTAHHHTGGSTQTLSQQNSQASSPSNPVLAVTTPITEATLPPKSSSNNNNNNNNTNPFRSGAKTTPLMLKLQVLEQLQPMKPIYNTPNNLSNINTTNTNSAATAPVVLSLNAVISKPSMLRGASNITSGTMDEVKDPAAMSGSPLKWIKGELIGEGTFGKVFKGLNEKTGQLLAIKQFFLVDESEEEIESLCKEIHVMWSLNHENIVRYVGTTRTPQNLFILLEYITGGSIETMIKSFGSFSENLIR